MVPLSYTDLTRATNPLDIPCYFRKLFIAATDGQVYATENNDQTTTSLAKFYFTKVKRTFSDGPDIPSFARLS